MQVSKADRDRQAHRREQNRLAAERCRWRREQTTERLSTVCPKFVINSVDAFTVISQYNMSRSLKRFVAVGNNTYFRWWVHVSCSLTMAYHGMRYPNVAWRISPYMITYLPLYRTPVLPVRNIFLSKALTYNGRRLKKSALRICTGYYSLSIFLA